VDDLLKMIDSRKLQFKVFTLEHAFRSWKWDANAAKQKHSRRD